MDLQLSGKRALVTSGSRGIGFQVARSLEAEGVRAVAMNGDPVVVGGGAPGPIFY
ncbi:hypothetical protein [Actinoplanes sp. NPDC089786]|uniref:hypothetical protein n=1 Tax=Actinoplanes sp. NPDC089786 TaxID=3155185 RepID=UPI00341E0116